MKQDTTPEQTAKLIELGFTQPKTKLPFEVANNELGYTYSIGELISILPQTINTFYNLSILSDHKGWWVLYGMIGDGDMWSIEYEVYRNEIIDALYDMIVKLKEEVIL